MFLGVVLLAFGCKPDASERAPDPPGGDATSAARPWFEDATEELRMDFTHDAGTIGSYFMPEVIGSGAALLDYDGDGRLDIYLLQNGDPPGESRKPPSTNRLYHQKPDGRFTDVSDGSGLDVAGRGMGAAVGDLSNDGRPDVLVTEYGRTRLFLNRGDGTFADITSSAGIDNPFWGTSAACVDFDRDGWLDLAIVNYVVYSATRPCTDQGGKRDYCGPAPFPGSVTRLYRNLGIGSGTARFEDVTVASGLGARTGPGLGILCADFDGDRWPDLFVANDGKPNFLWINGGDGTFREEAVLRGLAYNAMGKSQADMGIAMGDADGDGLFDLFVTHLTDELHVFWRQGPRGQFLDQTAAVGLVTTHWRSTGFGAVMGDFDHDGFPDLAQVNGRVKFVSGPSPPGESFWEVYKERNQLFANDGTGRFGDVSLQNPAFCGKGAVARGLAKGDLDGDGDLDLLVTTVDAPARIYRNVAEKKGHWLLVRAVDPTLGGRDAIGAEIMVRAGGRRHFALIHPAYSYLVSSDPRAHVGLGAAERVDGIDVIWPDGSEESFGGRAADQLIVLRKGEGSSSQDTTRGPEE